MLGGPFGGVSGGGVAPPNYVKMSVKYLLISKKTGTLA